jgi:hypothetical protein
VTRPCSSPIADDALLDWWAGEIVAADGRHVEEHLLACDRCAGRLRLIQAMADGIRALLRGGRLPVVILPAVLGRLRREGRRIREYRVPPGGAVHCTVAPEDDVVLARLAADLRGVQRLDLVSRMGDEPEERLSDLPYDPTTGEVVFAPPADVLRARPAHVQRLRLLAVGPQGERPIGEYTFNHTPWPGADGRS